jgi:hypothetical protein
MPEKYVLLTRDSANSCLALAWLIATITACAVPSRRKGHAMFRSPCVHVLAGPICLHGGTSPGPWEAPLRSPLGKDMHASSVALQYLACERATDTHLTKICVVLPQLHVKANAASQDMSSFTTLQLDRRHVPRRFIHVCARGPALLCVCVCVCV